MCGTERLKLMPPTSKTPQNKLSPKRRKLVAKSLSLNRAEVVQEHDDVEPI
jgi:hypothetical protein